MEGERSGRAVQREVAACGGAIDPAVLSLSVGGRFEADEIDEPALGYVIEDKVMQVPQCLR